MLIVLTALQVPLYTAEIVERYVTRGTPRDGSEAPEPHVFLTADSAYKAMARNNASQSLVITGESGSGKTETTKIAMQVCRLIMHCAGSAHMFMQRSVIPSHGAVICATTCVIGKHDRGPTFLACTLLCYLASEWQLQQM